jgi:hypothetical protein
MIRTDLVAPSHEKKGGHDGQNVDPLHETHQQIAAKDAVDQKQATRNEPDHPGQRADPPCALLNVQVMYLRVISDDDKRRPNPSNNFHASVGNSQV